MAILKPGQLSPGPYNISGSFSGSFSGNGSNLTNLLIPQIETGSFVTTSSFNAFTGSYNTGSFTGSFIGNGSGLTGVISSSFALTASYAVSASYEINYETSSSYAETASVAISASYAATASYVQNAQTASYILNAASSSFSTTASFATNALSASFASTVPASGVIGLNLTQIATSSFSASVSPTQFTITSASITELTVIGTGVTIGSAPTDTHRVTGSLTTLGTSSFTNPTQLSGNQTTSPLITLNQSLVSFGNSSVMFRASETSINNSFAVELYKRSGNSETRFLAGGNGTGTNTERSFMTVIGTNTAGDGSVTFDRSVGIGSTPSSSIRLDVRAQGALSTDIAFRVRNSADNADIFTANGDGTQNWFRPANNQLSTIKSGTYNFIQWGNENFHNIAIGYNLSNLFTPTDGYNVLIGGGTSIGSGVSEAIRIGTFGSTTGIGSINIGYASRASGQYTIKIGRHTGASSFGGTNSIHLGRTVSGNDITADDVFMTYFNSDISSTLIRANGSLGLLGQQAYIYQNGTGALGLTTRMGDGGNTLVVRNHPSVPTLNITDSFQQYSADITAGNAAPHFRTENGSIIKLYQQSAVTSSQGIADALTNLGFLTGSSVIPSGGSFGIANSSGVYTYYTTFSASIAAATSGQTVEMFADVIETTNISIALKDGVNINGNGHTYTLNQAGTANCIQDGGVAVNCSISNITFKRLGGTPSSTNTLCMYITGASIIKAYSTILIGGATNMRCLTINNSSSEVYGIYAEGYNPTITVTNGTLNDSTGKSLNGGGISVGASGKIVKCIGYGINVAAIDNAGTSIDSYGYSSGVAGFNNTGTAINCNGWSVGAGGFVCGVGSTNVNCTGYSTSQIGFYSNGAVNVVSCKGYSTAGAGLAMINGAAYDSMGFSTTSYGIWVTNSGATATDLRSCKAISLAAIALFMNNTTSGCKIYNTEAYSKWNNVAGHGIVVAGANAEIVQCTVEVTNASANCISGSSALTTKYANNAFKGSTVAVNANITQGIVNTHDNQGNILV